MGVGELKPSDFCEVRMSTSRESSVAIFQILRRSSKGSLVKDGKLASGLEGDDNVFGFTRQVRRLDLVIEWIRGALYTIRIFA